MSDILKAAFIFVAPNAVAETHNNWVKTEQVQVKTIAVKDYQQAGKLLMHSMMKGSGRLNCARVSAILVLHIW